MWHVKDEIAPAILLVVDFGGWYRLDSRSPNCSSSDMIQHTQVSVIKDVIVPYTHLLPKLHLSENKERRNLLYFKGAKHRHRVSIVSFWTRLACFFLWNFTLASFMTYNWTWTLTLLFGFFNINVCLLKPHSNMSIMVSLFIILFYTRQEDLIISVIWENMLSTI
jgi:hypothetical protein